MEEFEELFKHLGLNFPIQSPVSSNPKDYSISVPIEEDKLLLDIGRLLEFEQRFKVLQESVVLRSKR